MKAQASEEQDKWCSVSLDQRQQHREVAVRKPRHPLRGRHDAMCCVYDGREQLNLSKELPGRGRFGPAAGLAPDD